ncbi:MAG: RND family transporter [Candidatus Binatia bacterium]
MTVPRWSSRWCRFVAHHKMIFLLALSALLWLGLRLSQHVALSEKMTDYLPARHPHAQLYREFTEMMKMTNSVVVTVTVKHGTIYTNDTLGKIHRLTVALLDTKGVNPFEVMSLTNPRLKDIRVREGRINILPVVDHPEAPKSPKELAHIKNAVYTNAGIRGVYVSPDDKTALIRAGFWDGMAEPRTVFTRLQDITARERDANTSINFTGNLVLAAWLMDTAGRVLLLLITSSVVAFLASWYLLGLGSGIVLALLVLLCGTVGGFGLLGLWSLALEPLTFLILFPLGVRGLVLVLCWQTQIATSSQAEPAPFADREHHEQVLDHTAHTLLWPLTLALGAEALAFLGLSVTDVPVIHSVGLLGVGWIMGLGVALWLLLPLWSATFSLHRASVRRHAWVERLAARLTRHSLTRTAPAQSLPLLPCTLAALGVVAALQLHAGRTMLGTSLFYSSHPYNRAFAIVDQHFVGVNQLIVIAQATGQDAFRNPQALQAIEALEYHMAEDHDFGGSLAITTLIKAMTRMFHEDVPKWEVIPDDIDSTGQVMFRVISSAATPSEVARFFSNDFRTTAITFFYRQYSPTLVTRILHQAHAFAATSANANVQFRVGGGLLGILSAIHTSVERTYWRYISLFIFFPSLGVLISSRSLHRACGAGLSLLLVEAALLLLLWLGGIDLNMYTLPVIVISMGTVIFPTFLFWTHQDVRLWLPSITKASFITAGGAAVWLLSPLRFQAEMGGVLIVIAVLSVLVPMPVQQLLRYRPLLRASTSATQA